MIPIGMLAVHNGLSVNESVLITILATFTGTIWPAFTGTLSPRTGLRQIAVSRYAFGVWGSKLCGFLNILVNVGYAVIECILGGSLLMGVSDEQLPLSGGIIIIALIGFSISFLGFRVIHVFERYAWICAFLLLCVVWAQTSSYFTFDPSHSTVPDASRVGLALNYFAVVLGVSASWCPITGDYYVHYPADVNSWLVFGLTFLGQTIPMLFVGLLGNYLGGAVSVDQDYNDTYEAGGIGMLLMQLLSPRGWAKVVCFLFAFSFSKSPRFPATHPIPAPCP